MKIKRLEILGFKSFADKTVVHFKDGITGVVGPNGCGKSNIVDAIRWVMGEMSAKHLRGKSMDDVIFAGTEKRPPTGLAEVTLVFSAEGGGVPAAYANYSEIAVRRRLYRSGESEYAVNNVVCRLKDVHDLFLGTGVGVKAYSIIEQGRIGQVINAKPEERRLILEEAAGISKFKSRKAAALRKIEATRSNLLRLDDILTELTRQKNSLERQSKKAARYREIETELRELELKLSSLTYLESSKKLKTLESDLKGIEESEAKLAAEVSELENKIEQDRIVLLEKDRQYLSLQEELYENQNSLQLNQAEVDYKTREIDTLHEQNQTAAREIEVVKGRLERLDGEIAKTNSHQVGIDLEFATAQESFSELEEKVSLALTQEQNTLKTIEAQNEAVYTAMRSLSENNAQKESHARRKVDLKGRMGRDQSEIDEIDGLLKERQEKLTQIEGALSGVRQLKMDLGGQQESLEATLNKQRSELTRLEAELNTRKESLNAKTSRLKSLEELQRNFEGYQEGVRHVLKKQQGSENESARVFGTVAEMLETNSEYESAVSAALGEKLQYVLVPNQEAGLKSLQYLKDESRGRLTCLPMGVRASVGGGEMGMQQALSASAQTGVIGPLQDFVQLKGEAAEASQVSQYLFSDVYLVESLNKALELWQQDGVANSQTKRFVTLDGEVLDSAGVLSGGSKHNPSYDLLEKKREMKELGSQTQILKAQVDHLQTQVDQIKQRIEKMSAALESLKKEAHNEEIKLVHQEQDLTHLKNEIRRLSERRDKLALEISADSLEEKELNQEIENLSTQQSELEANKTAAEEKLSQFKTQVESEKTTLETLRAEMMDARSALALVEEKKSNFEKDLTRMNQEKVEAQHQLEEKQQSITQANARSLKLKEEIEENKTKITHFVQLVQNKETGIQELKDKVTQLQESLRVQEDGLKAKRGELEAQRQNLNQKIIDLSEGRSQIKVLCEQILERYHIDLASVAEKYRPQESHEAREAVGEGAEQVEDQVESFDREAETQKAKELRERLEKMGSVNLAAIEEYDETKERHEFLAKQYEDLESSLDGLLKALQKVNRTTKKRLEDTYVKVNELFQEVFPRLFEGGKAELRLTDPENILESGVEMIVQPPGKKLQNAALMSGGEKALTAISLVFSLFLLKPSPFCLLDEVDAPLDDVNIGRFNEIVRSMVDRSQFILITHNKQTMEMADVLYGITMEQAGVSKMVSVDLQ